MNVAPGGTGAAIPDTHDAYRPNPSSSVGTTLGGTRVMTADKGSTEVWGWHPDQPSVWILEDTSINLPSVGHCP